MGEVILEQLLTAEELAGLLKIKAKTLLNWAGHGRIPSYKINGVRRFKLSEVNRWLDEERLREQKDSLCSNAMVSKLRFLKTGNNRLKGNQRGTKGTL
jgi:excisionase family DNA binding protein